MHPRTLISRAVLLLLAGSLSACVVEAPPPRIQTAPVPVVAYEPAPPGPVVSVYIEPPVSQPPPVLVAWAPPPMLVEVPPPIPFGGAVWVGGYWAWQGTWVWASGRWAPPPQPNYAWVNPYYENRGGAVVFVTGHWSPRGVAFVPPPVGLSLSVAIALPGVVPGPRPIGPPGVFVPPPPGSRPGLIVPAPIGTAPAVVVGAPPVTNVGMRIQNRVENNVTINNVTNVTNNVTIVAPASATVSGRPFQAQAPALAHLAAAQTPVMHFAAPQPSSPRPIAAFAADRPPPALPAPQVVQMRREGPGGAGPSPTPPQRAESVPSSPPPAAARAPEPPHAANPPAPPVPGAQPPRPQEAVRVDNAPAARVPTPPAPAAQKAPPRPPAERQPAQRQQAERPPAPRKPAPAAPPPRKGPSESEEHKREQ